MKLGLYVVLMVLTIVAADFLFLRHNFRARLIVNVAIVAVFLGFYLAFLRRK